MKKAVIILTPGFDEASAVTIADVLKRLEIPVTLMAWQDDLMVKGSIQIRLKADVKWPDDMLAYDILILPGGQLNPMPDEQLLQKIQEFYQSGRNLAAVGTGIRLLQMAGLDPEKQDRMLTRPYSAGAYDLAFALGESCCKNSEYLKYRLMYAEAGGR